jgi:polysaccharide export outer membrane protein
MGIDTFPVAEAVPAPAAAPSLEAQEEYRIGPRDILRIAVFNEPQLSFEELPVSSGGVISLPLIGAVQAVGLTPVELGNAIDQRLNERFLRGARSAVSVVTATNYTVTVDGAVEEPGVYDIPGKLSLSQALALAGGASQFARLDEVVVIRKIGDQQYAARFNIREVRAGRVPDLQLRQSDTVIVGLNRAAQLFRDIVTTLPSAAAVFVALR